MFFIPVFPHDLSILRVYTALFTPTHQLYGFNKSKSDHVMRLVSNLIDHMPSIAHPLFEVFSSNFCGSTSSGPNNRLYPQLTDIVDPESMNEIKLSNAFNFMCITQDMFDSSSIRCDCFTGKNLIFSGVQMSAGTSGLIRPGMVRKYLFIYFYYFRLNYLIILVF